MYPPLDFNAKLSRNPNAAANQRRVLLLAKTNQDVNASRPSKLLEFKPLFREKITRRSYTCKALFFDSPSRNCVFVVPKQVGTRKEPVPLSGLARQIPEIRAIPQLKLQCGIARLGRAGVWPTLCPVGVTAPVLSGLEDCTVPARSFCIKSACS